MEIYAMTYCYVPLLRPAWLPWWCVWSYVEAPRRSARHDIPRSTHRYGIIATARKLMKDDLERYGMREA